MPDVDTMVMHVNAAIYSAKGKLPWNQESISRNGRILVSSRESKDIWRIFQDERFYATEVATDTTNISE